MPIKRGVPDRSLARAGIVGADEGVYSVPAVLRHGAAESAANPGKLSGDSQAAARGNAREGRREQSERAGGGDNTQTLKELVTEEQMAQIEAQALEFVKSGLPEVVKFGKVRSVVHLLIMDKIASGGNGNAQINPMIRASRSFQEDLLKLHESGIDNPATTGIKKKAGDAKA